MKKAKSRYLNVLLAMSCLLGSSSSVLGQNISTQETKSKDTKTTESKEAKTSESKDTKTTDSTKVVETPIENVMAVTVDQLVTKPEEYLNKNVKFTAPFFAFSNLALDYKPAFRSSRTYLSFLVLRINSHTPFSEIKFAMLIPKEKDPQTKMLQTLKEGDIVEITGHVFAASLDEPWVDVLKLKKIASAKKNDNAEDKATDDKESSSEDQSSEK